jgi:serine/threonine-protein kinase
MPEQSQHFPFRQVDDFRLNRLIYEGLHTYVYLGRQISLEREVIIKLLRPQVENRKGWIERFRREARVCARLKHPHIVDVYALGEKDGYHYIASEYVKGLSLKELLQAAGTLPVEIALSIADSMLQALDFVQLHRIVHRDVKPGNILLNSLGQAKLSDFGLAYIEEEPTVTRQGSIIGTPAYMAPEQISGDKADGRTDLFALGAVLYEMLSGQQAFGGENYSACLYKIMNENPPLLSEVKRDISEDLAAWVDKIIRKTPEERWPDAGTARLHLQRLLPTKPEQGKLAGFMQTFLPDPSSRFPEAPSDSGNVFPGIKHPNKRSWSAAKRRWLFSGGLAVMIIAILLMLRWQWPGEPDSYANRHAKSLSPASADSPPGGSLAGSDSLVLSPSLSEDNTSEKANESREDNIKKIPPPRPVTTPDTALTLSSAGSSSEPATSPARSDVRSETELDIRVEPWAKLVIDGREVDSHAVHQRFPVDPGKYTITFLHPNFSPRVMEVEVKAGEQKNVHWSFFDTAGYLWVEARPWADVFIDGKLYDSTPLKEAIILSSGQHLIELKHPQFASYREFVTIMPGDTTRVQTVLKNQ